MRLSETIEAKKGVYIGDLCYVLPDEIYQRDWGDKHNFKSGNFTYNGYHYIMDNTAYGDGLYEGRLTMKKPKEQTLDFPVDAGIIGICNIELVPDIDKAGENGLVMLKPGKYTFEVSDDCNFTITGPGDEKLVITTYYEDSFNEDGDEDCDNEEEM